LNNKSYPKVEILIPIIRQTGIVNSDQRFNVLVATFVNKGQGIKTLEQSEKDLKYIGVI